MPSAGGFGSLTLRVDRGTAGFACWGIPRVDQMAARSAGTRTDQQATALMLKTRNGSKWENGEAEAASGRLAVLIRPCLIHSQAIPALRRKDTCA